MAGINKVILVGNLGKDPEMRHGQASGTAVTRFTLATTEKYGGEERTEWHQIVCFGRLAEIANEYLTKGRQVYIEGRIQTRSWEDQSGNKRYSTEIIANTMQMLGRRDESGGGDYAPAPQQARNPSAPARSSGGGARQAPADDPFSGDFGPPPTDDDMPF